MEKHTPSEILTPRFGFHKSMINSHSDLMWHSVYQAMEAYSALENSELLSALSIEREENKKLKEAVKSLIGLAELGAERAADNSRPEERSGHLDWLLTIISEAKVLIQDNQSKKL